ncbi:hypothetical protein [Altericroceibacterium xinjiangense]|uniref:hypothetical protein n=1 Tax=Altericroceibacterium xinjiangense TaxID=762261 RepID=UPI001F496E1F|nr:hypothetical protein [Altericroceibacterium xinjiangense]
MMLALAALCAGATPASAQVKVSFQSFNGSFFGRYPHTFVVFEGTLDSTGQPVNENYGFSAETAGPAVLAGPVKHVIIVEGPKYVRTTNRHFTIPISDETYLRMKQEVTTWRKQPGNYYDLDRRNCIHFVGRMAQLAGLTVDYPAELLRKPKQWLNHIAALNPRLGARRIR